MGIQCHLAKEEPEAKRVRSPASGKVHRLCSFLVSAVPTGNLGLCLATHKNHERGRAGIGETEALAQALLAGQEQSQNDYLGFLAPESDLSAHT